MGRLNEREVTRRYLDKAVDLLDEAIRETSSDVSQEFLDRIYVAQGYLLQAGDYANEGHNSDCCGAVDQCGSDCVDYEEMVAEAQKPTIHITLDPAVWTKDNLAKWEYAVDVIEQRMKKSMKGKASVDTYPAHRDLGGTYVCDCAYCKDWRAREAATQACGGDNDCCNQSSGDEEVGEADNSYHTKMLNRLYPIIETLIQMRGEVQSGVGFINQPINSNNKEYLNEAIGSLRDLELALRVEQAVNAHA